MERIEKSVFISYRRTNFPWALAVRQSLAQEGYDVFLDYEGLAAGEFETAIIENIRARAHFLIILTPSALERCGQQGDWLRREIETALESKRNIVPIMLEEFSFDVPAIASQLTGKLAALKRYQALTVPNQYFPEAMARLRTRFLEVPLTAVIHRPSESARQAAMEQQTAAEQAPQVEDSELAAMQYYERGVDATDPDEEIRLNSEAIRLRPNFSEAYFNRGLAHENTGNLKGALRDYDSAIRFNPTDVDSYNNRGAARQAQGDFDGSIADFTKYIHLRPHASAAYYNRALARESKRDLKGAIEDYSEAIRLKDNFADAYYNRGLLRRRTRQNADAIADFQRFLKLGGGTRDGVTREIEDMIRELRRKNQNM